MGRYAQPKFNRPKWTRPVRRHWLGFFASFVLALTLSACGGGGGGGGPATSGLATISSNIVTLSSFRVPGATTQTTDGKITWGNTGQSSTLLFDANGNVLGTYSFPYPKGKNSLTISVPSQNYSHTEEVNITADPPDQSGTNRNAPSITNLTCTPSKVAQSAQPTCSAERVNDADGDAVTCNIKIDNQAEVTRQSCVAPYQVKDATSVGNHTVVYTPVDSRGLSGAAASATFEVQAATGDEPAAPTVNQTDLSLSRWTSQTFFASGGKPTGDGCPKLFSSESTTPIVQNRQGTWSYQFTANPNSPLTKFLLQCENSQGVRTSVPYGLIYYWKSSKPKDPVINSVGTPDGNGSAVINGTVTNDCALKATVGGVTRTVMPVVAYVEADRNTIRNIDQPLVNVPSSATSAVFWCEDDAKPTANRTESFTVPIGNNNNGGGNNTNNNAPTGSMNCSANGLTVTCNFTCQLNGATSGTGVLQWQGQDSNGNTTTAINSCADGSRSLTYTNTYANNTLTPYMVWTGNGGATNTVNSNNSVTLGNTNTATVWSYQSSYARPMAGSYLMAGNQSSDEVYLATETCIGRYSGSGAQLTAPVCNGVGGVTWTRLADITVCPDGRVAMVDAPTNRVIVLSSTLGYSSDFAHAPLSGGANGIGCGQLANNGTYMVGVTDAQHNTAFLFTITGAVQWQYSINSPRDIAVGTDGMSFISTTSATEKVDGSGQRVTSPNFVISGLSSPGRIAVDTAASRLFVADYDLTKIKVTDMSGNNIALIGSSGTGSGQFQSPTAIGLGSGSRLRVLGVNEDRITVFQ